MSLLNYTRQRYYAVQNSSLPNSYGIPVLADDFKTVLVDLEQNALNGQLAIYASDQYDAPDVSQAEGPNNDFHEVPYTDTRNGVMYTPAGRYNPSSSTPGGNARFNVESTGARWIIACIINRSAGTTTKLAVAIYDNQ